MIYSRWGDWSYNKHSNNSSTKIASVTNNEGKKMLLKSITLHLGVAAANTSANWGDSVTGNGGSVTIYLSTSYSGRQNASNSKTISTTRSTYTNKAGTLRTYYTNDLPQVTFSFGDGILMDNNTTLYFYYNRDSGTNVLICPKDGRQWDGKQYSTQNVSGNATEPYKTPTISISTSNYYSRYDTSRNITVAKNTSGDNSGTTVKVTVNGNTETTSIGNNEASYNFTPSRKGVSDGVSYKVYATRIHNSNTSLSATSNTLTLNTYRTPKIQSVSVSPADFSGIGNSTLSWSCNGRRWTSNNEADFKTYYQFDGKPWLETGYNDPNTGDTNNAFGNGSMALSESIITSNFTKDERSQEKITTKLYVKRKNETSQVEATANSSNITIQLWPKYEVNTVKYKNTSTGVAIEAGTDQYTDTTPKITVSWNYSTNADRGVISGYIVRVYRNDKTTQVGSDHIIPTTALSGSIDLNTKSDLYRGELNYIKIIPYYTLPNNSSKKEGPSTLYTFVTPIGRIHKPIISFPTHNSNWHNKQFRILLKAPEDDDMDVLGLSDAEYEYNNIELIISGKDSENKTYELKYTLNDNNNIFSNQNIHHKYNIVINPSIITAFPELLYYDIKIRFQKKYYKNIWSEYSDSIHLGISKIKELDLKKEQIIYIDHYSTIRKYSVQLWEVYFNKKIESINSDNIERKQHDIIYARDYQGIYNTILNIQSRVNNYTTFDNNRDNIKFNQSITNLSDNNKVKQELITSAKISNDPIGRNYKNILVECMNKLY